MKHKSFLTFSIFILTFAILNCTGTPAAYAYDPMCEFYEEHNGACCSDCHDMVSCATTNLFCVPSPISTPNSGEKPVVYDSADSQVNGTQPYNGVCEVCHTQTRYHRNNASGDHTHCADKRCTSCHMHGPTTMVSQSLCYTCHGGSAGDVPAGNPPMFSSPIRGHAEAEGADCDSCHGHDGESGTVVSHSTHTENDSDDVKGPHVTCSTCHDTNNYPYFKSGTGTAPYDLSETDVCDDCHSKGGAFDGVDDPDIGVKHNWDDGVYESDGTTLKSGNEQWCAGCHDDAPAYSRQIFATAASIVMDTEDVTLAEPDSTWNFGYTAIRQYGGSFCVNLAGTGNDTATWIPNVSEAGFYKVFAWWVDAPNRATDAPYTINFQGGSETVDVNQQINGGQWNLLGTYYFAEGTSGSVVLSDDANERVVCDAVRFDPCTPPGTYAPNVIGDDTTYGFYVTGHNTDCLSCHDSSKDHVDHEHRTYSSVADNYQAGYRLKQSMNIPRAGGSVNATDFRLCFTCHDSDQVLASSVSHTNFWHDDASVINSHYLHLGMGSIHTDSDWDGVADTAETCTTCHNVHGSGTPAMIRDGKLISSYGTTDKVPALNFLYLPGGTTLALSTAARMDFTGGLNLNGVCQPCHQGITYSRDPKIFVSAGNPKADPTIATNDGSGSSTATVYVMYNGEGALTVEIDLSSIGGGTETMTDEGSGVYSYQVDIPVSTSEGFHDFDVLATASDTSDQGSTTVSVLVIGPGTIDNVEAVLEGTWNWGYGSYKQFGPSFCVKVAGSGSGTATFTPDIDTAGTYDVYAWWVNASNRATDAPYTINHAGGSETVDVNQQINGGQWNLLGTYDFAEGTSGSVVLSDDANERVVADAIKWELQP